MAMLIPEHTWGGGLAVMWWRQPELSGGSWLSVAVNHHDQKQHFTKESQGRNLRQRAYLLASQGLVSHLSYTFQDHKPRGDTAHSRLTLPQPSRKQENTIDLLTDQHDKGFVSVKIPSFQICLGLCHVDKTN